MSARNNVVIEKAVTEKPATEKATSPVDDSRLRMGIETTLLAWVRTGMALMGFGFVVARFGLFLQEMANVELIQLRHQPGFSLWLGVAMIVAGTLVTSMAGVLTWR